MALNSETHETLKLHPNFVTPKAIETPATLETSNFKTCQDFQTCLETLQLLKL